MRPILKDSIREFGKIIYILPYSKQIINKDLMYRKRNKRKQMNLHFQKWLSDYCKKDNGIGLPSDLRQERKESVNENGLIKIIQAEEERKIS